MIFSFVKLKKKRQKRKVKIVRKYEPKNYITIKDKEIFNSFMEKNIKEEK